MLDDAATYDTLRRLLALAGTRRIERADNMEVVEAIREGDVLTAKVNGRARIYNCRITLAPRRGFRCDCPDCRGRGRQVGPCKHLIKTAQVFLADEVV